MVSRSKRQPPSRWHRDPLRGRGDLRFTLAAAVCGGGDAAEPTTTTATMPTRSSTSCSNTASRSATSSVLTPTSATVSGDRRGDFDEQVHVHGYDLYIEPDAADPTLEFDALIPGRFEIELEQSGRLVLELTVS